MLITTQSKKAETVGEIVNSISKIPDPIKREIYIRNVPELWISARKSCSAPWRGGKTTGS
ncbi:MAG: hypothetical protein R2783_04375 [Gelidibacter sp.]